MRAAKPGPIVSLQNVSVRRDQAILIDISWQIHQGEHWVLLGANGSGKTSLLKILTGYLGESNGHVHVIDDDLEWQVLRAKIGMVSSSVAQRIEHDETAFDVVVSGRAAMINHWGPISREDRERANRVLRQVEASALARRPWGLLSQGERQRVLVGRALMNPVKLLVLDEPCAGLDPVARERFLAFVDRLGRAKRGPSIVLVTHHIEEITPVFSHVMILKDGATLAQGTCRACLKSTVLSDAFGSDVRVNCREGRYALSVVEEASGKSAF